MYKNDKNMKHHSFLIFKLFSFSVLAVLLTGCSESFLEQEPQKVQLQLQKVPPSPILTPLVQESK